VWPARVLFWRTRASLPCAFRLFLSTYLRHPIPLSPSSSTHLLLSELCFYLACQRSSVVTASLRFRPPVAFPCWTRSPAAAQPLFTLSRPTASHHHRLNRLHPPTHHCRYLFCNTSTTTIPPNIVIFPPVNRPALREFSHRIETPWVSYFFFFFLFPPTAFSLSFHCPAIPLPLLLRRHQHTLPTTDARLLAPALSSQCTPSLPLPCSCFPTPIDLHVPGILPVQSKITSLWCLLLAACIGSAYLSLSHSHSHSSSSSSSSHTPAAAGLCHVQCLSARVATISQSQAFIVTISF
jgi:hypothetical protein